MLEIIRYTPDYQKEWDSIVKFSKNGTFLFFREYMDYHSDRFNDCSFLILKKGKIVGVLPGNLDFDCYISHQGLTYGGLVSSDKTYALDVIEIFNLLNKELRQIGIKEIIYKPVPLIYHRIPAQEDIYALFKNKAEKIGCNMSSTIFQTNKLKFTESRNCGIRKSRKSGVKICESIEFALFWKIIENNLSNKYNTKPVHSLYEIEYLKNRFPENIKLYAAKKDDVIIAGTVIFLMKNIVHVQYISANETGKENGALDMLFDQLINKEFENIPVFDFGQSTEKMGNFLNENLIFQKEGFGGRGIVYDIYKYKLT